MGLSQNETLQGVKAHEIEAKRLAALVEELQREKIELTNDLIEKNTKLDEMMGVEEQLHSVKNNLELDIYSKQLHINECEKMIETLHAKNREVVASASRSQASQQMVSEFEAQIVELKLKVANREHEVQKTREMYIEVCNEKNNLQESVREQLERENEARVSGRVRAEVEARLEEQRRQAEAGAVEVRGLRERLAEGERACGQLRAEKSEVEARMGRAELEMQSRCASLEKAIKEVRVLLFFLFVGCRVESHS